MPRARSPDRDRAKQLWLESGKKRMLKEIAAELGVSETQVRKWKSQDRWDGDGKGTLPKESAKGKGNVTKRPRGAPKGNQNAVGNHGGAPKGNTNSMKHGSYRQIFDGILSEEEHVFVENMSFNQADLIRQEIATLTTRERYLMREIVKLRSNSSNLAIHTVCKEGDDTSTTAVNTIQYIRTYEAELTKVQRAKAMYVRMLMEVENRRADAPASGQDEVDLSGISEEELRRLATLVEECEETQPDRASGEAGTCPPTHG